MFQGSSQLWSIRGIPIRIHFTWLIIFGLLSGSIHASVWPTSAEVSRMPRDEAG